MRHLFSFAKNLLEKIFVSGIIKLSKADCFRYKRKRGAGMRSKSPELMSEIKKYIEDYYLQNRQSPSTTKIAEAVGIARGTAYKYLVEMAEKNMIEYDGQEISTNVTRKYSGEQTQTPIVGSIPCGSPQYEEENIEEYVSLPTAIFGKGDFFILRASGQSWTIVNKVDK